MLLPTILNYVVSDMKDGPVKFLYLFFHTMLIDNPPLFSIQHCIPVLDGLGKETTRYFLREGAP